MTQGFAVGTVIAGRYRVLGKLGEGGMGTVYRAVQEPLGREVALKVISSSRTPDAETIARFHREARASSALAHPNIVTIFDFGDDNGTLYLAMELLSGAGLDDVLKQGALPLPRALRLLRGICSGLAEAHSKGIIHRDLKPPNVMVTSTSTHADVAKVVDFGIAKVGEGSTVTSTGMIVGTPGYLAPELFNSKPPSPQTDLYAFGVIAFELLCARPPFLGTTNLELMKSHVFDAPPSPKSLRAEIPELLDQLVLALLAKAPTERPASARVVDDVLARVEEELKEQQKQKAVALAPPAPPAPAPPTPTQQRYGLAPASATEATSLTPTLEPLPTQSGRGRAVGLGALVVTGLVVLGIGIDRLVRDEEPATPPTPAGSVAVAPPPAEPISDPPEPLESAPPKKEEQKPKKPPPPAPSAPSPAVALVGQCPGGMAKVAAGTFTFGSRGSDPMRNFGEQDAHSEAVAEFCIDYYEAPNGKDTIPTTGVSWAAAKNACDRGGKRLCTEAEWERACKGPASSRFPYGEEFDREVCNADRDEEAPLAPATSFKRCRSGFKVYAMSGNAEEWVADSIGTQKLAKGGSAARPDFASRCAARRVLSPKTTSSELGYRCCADPR